jgi:hypothetical protein
MSDADRDDARVGVEIAIARLVEDILHVPFDEHQGFAIIGDEAGRQILMAKREYLLATWAVVGRRLMIAAGKYR